MLRRFAEYLVIQILICVIGVMTIEMCASFSRGVAWFFSDVIKFRRKVIEGNIVAVYPDISKDQIREMTRQMWYHLIMMACELVHVPRRIHDSNWQKYVHIRDRKLMTRYLIDYRPLIAVTGHFGNFEMAGFTTGLLGMPSYTVARKLDNDLLNDYVNKFREANGQFILPKDGSAGRVQEVLDSGAILTILGDQHAGTKGCWINFLGRPAACHKAVALFTLSGNAPMMVSYCKHTDKPLHFEIGCTGVADPLEMDNGLHDVKKLTQWYNDRMADAIYSAPDQYWWVHRRWKEKPVRKTKKRLEQAAAEMQEAKRAA